MCIARTDWFGRRRPITYFVLLSLLCWLTLEARSPSTALSSNQTVNTSISWYVKNPNTQPTPSPIANVTVRLFFSRDFTLTNTDGSFTLPVPGVRDGSQDDIILDVDGSTASPAHQGQLKAVSVTGGINNQPDDFIRLLPIQGFAYSAHGRTTASPAEQFGFADLASALAAGGPSESRVLLSSTVGAVSQPSIKSGQAGEAKLVFPEKPTITFANGKVGGAIYLNTFARERTPSALPRGHYSSAIVQLAPFGASIKPGAKLVFPNPDRIPAKTAVPLFRFDQRRESQTLGSFIQVGTATVTPDGQQVVTDGQPITETSYYFVSMERATATLKGRVLESNGQPVRRAIIISRGQFTYSKDNGEFELPGVPVLGAKDQAIVEVDVLRANGRVDSAERTGVSLTVGETIVINPPFVPLARSPNSLRNRK
jgi:hypothetical protein